MMCMKRPNEGEQYRRGGVEHLLVAGALRGQERRLEYERDLLVVVNDLDGERGPYDSPDRQGGPPFQSACHQRRFSCGRAEPSLPPTMAMEWIVAHAVPGDLLVVEGGWVFIVLPDAAA
jgi:hypothetical protein